MWALQGITVGGPSQEVREVTVVAGCGAARHAEAARASKSVSATVQPSVAGAQRLAATIFAEPLPDAG
jgi:hypothetical protein